MDPTQVQLSQAEVLKTIGEFKKSGRLGVDEEKEIVDLALSAQASFN